MTWPTILGIGSLIVVITVIVYGFRQGQKVRRPPEGVPPDRFQGGNLL
jgi:hypothetical protein